MRPHSECNGVATFHGKCELVLPCFEAESVHAVISDPPYGLEFVGNFWDRQVPGRKYWELCFRLLKPGGHLLAFGGPRTYHHLACAVEDAGFDVRDCIYWVYGGGFPKSHDVAAALVEERLAGAAEAAAWDGWGTALKPAVEPICVARKPFDESVARNVLRHGTGALHVGACRVGAEVITTKAKEANDSYSGFGANEAAEHVGRWPANLAHDGSPEVLEAFAAFGDKRGGFGIRGKGGHVYHGQANCSLDRVTGQTVGYDDSGSVARFYYCARASHTERGDYNDHPTVKPLALMRWLVRLVTPPGGLILDPFAGSGTTGLAAAQEGFPALLIEQDLHNCEIIARRMREWQMTPS